ncbi:MAG: carbon-nitrogen family hydrolase [bacterium]
MSRKIRVLGIQFTPELGNKTANFKKVEYLIESNSWFKPDLIVLPEVFNTGAGHNQLQALAEFIPEGATAEKLSSLASKYGANIVAGSYIERCPDEKFRNTSLIIDRSGNITGKYHKIHMFSYYGCEEGKYISPGDFITVVETDIGKIGLSICYDLRFPELYRALTYAGAEIIVCPAAWPYPRLEHWVTLNKARAIENLVYMISINQVGTAGNSRINLGHSMIINPWGDIVTSASSSEGVMIAEIDLDMLRKTREEFPVLNDRNIAAYENLAVSIE